MNEKPILFSGDMVRAILEGRKTQTRRVVRFSGDNFFKGITGQVQSHHELKVVYPMPKGGFVFWDSAVGQNFSDWCYENSTGGIMCPYGVPGDRLWVRETWATSPFVSLGIPPRDLDPEENEIIYRADIPDLDSRQSHYCWRPSIFMVRWMSRIALEVVSVRIERVQAISGFDACSEGVIAPDPGSPTRHYAELWDKINAKRGFGWDVNPWVWVVEFKNAYPPSQ